MNIEKKSETKDLREVLDELRSGKHWVFCCFTAEAQKRLLDMLLALSQTEHWRPPYHIGP
jgi:hypothetical protein